MDDKRKLIVATSIAPHGIENQQKSIGSWADFGWEIISYNVPDEINAVSKLFPNVRFVKVERDGSALTGKPFPYIYDILQNLKNEDADIFAYINSDIYISGLTHGLTSEIVKYVCDGSFVYAHRMDAKSMDSAHVLEAKSFRVGIDVFFFHRNLIDIYSDDGFLIGNVFWDYWFPLVAHLKGVSLLEIKHPVFYHVLHQSGSKRDEECIDYFSSLLADKYFESNKRKLMDTMLCAVTRRDNGISWLSEELASKRALIVVPQNATKEMIKSIESQTYKNKTIVCDDSYNETDCDYTFHPGAMHTYADCAIDVLVSEIEKRNADAIVCDIMGVVDITGSCDQIYTHTVDFKRYPIMIRTSKQYNGRICHLGLPLCNALLSLKKIFEKGFYLYPAGQLTKVLLENSYSQEYLQDLVLLGVCDINPRLWGSKIYGHEVFSPTKLNNDNHYNGVIVTSSQYEDEIVEYLTSFVPSEKIYRFSELVEECV